MNWLFKALLRSFANRYHYDVNYIEEMDRNAPGTLFRYLLAAPLGQYNRTAPTELFWSAKVTATQAQDCGPCVRLVYNMATEAGVCAEQLAALLTESEETMSEETRLGRLYAQAVLTQDAPGLADLGEQIEGRWGKGAIAELALAVAYGAFYPTLKRGLGHAQSCEPLIAEIRASGHLRPAPG